MLYYNRIDMNEGIDRTKSNRRKEYMICHYWFFYLGSRLQDSVFFFFFFFVWVFFHNHSRIIGLQGKGEGIRLIPYYQFHPYHTHLGISRAITAESSTLVIISIRNRTENLSFPSASL